MLFDIQLNFLSELKNNNNKQWFQQNKKFYKKAAEDFENFISELVNQIRKFSPEIPQFEPNKFIFRINRDLRFSKNKNPYKEYFAAFISIDGKKSPFAGYYIHVEPNNLFLGGGIYCTNSQTLYLIRKHIVEHTQKFLKIINNPSFKQNFGSIYGEKQKRLNKEFKNFPYQDLLLYKRYALVHHIDQTYTLDDIVKVFQIAKPFNDFLNEAILIMKQKSE